MNGFDTVKWWTERKTEYRIMYVDEVTIGPHTAHTIAECDAKKLCGLAMGIENLSHWLKATRAGGCEQVISSMANYVGSRATAMHTMVIPNHEATLAHAHEDIIALVKATPSIVLLLRSTFPVTNGRFHSSFLQEMHW